MKDIQTGPLMPLGVGGTINVACTGDKLLAIQAGSYHNLETGHNGQLLILDRKTRKVIGKLDGIGSARQITARDGVAYITSREDGLFTVDISDGAHPKLLCHYETTEFATGVCVAQNLLAVSLRHYGVELIDVTDPAHPRFVSLVRTGEAQSVWIDGAYLYAGVWGSREIVIANIENPDAPSIVCRVPLDGRGDGVTVRDGICFAATGQHARPPKDVPNPAPETYEKLGNGLEIFDVHDPACPVHLSTVKFPPYYALSYDMWSVRVSGDLVLVSDTRNGFFVVDISDLRAPRLLLRVLLPLAGDGDHDPVGGFDFCGDTIYLAGARTDLYAVTLTFDLAPERPASGHYETLPETWKLEVENVFGPAISWKRILEGKHVRSVADGGDVLFSACSQDGVLVLDKSDFSLLDRIPMEGASSVNTVLWRPPYLYAAQGSGGLAVYEKRDGGFVCTCRYSPHGRAVNDLQFSGDGRLLLLQCASLGVVALDACDPAHPTFLAEHLKFIGLFYGRHFPSVGFRNACYFGVNRDGLFELKYEEGKTALTELPSPSGRRFGVGPDAGLEVAGSTLLANHLGGYFLTPLPPTGDVPIRDAADGPVPYRGKPRADGDLLVSTERADGLITFCDGSDLRHIRVIAQLRTTASPDLAVFDREHVYIPGGRQGLLVFDRPALAGN